MGIWQSGKGSLVKGQTRASLGVAWACQQLHDRAERTGARADMKSAKVAVVVETRTGPNAKDKSKPAAARQRTGDKSKWEVGEGMPCRGTGIFAGRVSSCTTGQRGQGTVGTWQAKVTIVTQTVTGPVLKGIGMLAAARRATEDRSKWGSGSQESGMWYWRPFGKGWHNSI